ncbi:MAG: hypothetical protein LHW59_01275 [Candidatus Cloacimonetes bacterium]|nr:hypothetical protein [Candidatus Cloacimonadota bacterium]
MKPHTTRVVGEHSYDQKKLTKPISRTKKSAIYGCVTVSSSLAGSFMQSKT